MSNVRDVITDPLPAEIGGHLGDLFAAVTPEVADRLRRIARMRSVPKGTLLIEDGEHAPEVGYVLSGTLGMTKILADGRVHIVGLLVPTDMYGRIFDGPSTHRVEALSDCRLYRFDRRSFEDLLRDQPEVERMFLVHILDELDAAREWLILMNGRKVVERVASMLILLARRSGSWTGRRVAPVPVVLPLSRADLAHYLGTRPESLSRALHELANGGVVRILDPYRFEILDFRALVETSGCDLVLERPGERRQI